MEDTPNAGKRERPGRVDLAHARSRIGAAQHAYVQHARQVQVLGVLRPPGDAGDAVDAGVTLADDRQGVLSGP